RVPAEGAEPTLGPAECNGDHSPRLPRAERPMAEILANPNSHRRLTTPKSSATPFEFTAMTVAPLAPTSTHALRTIGSAARSPWACQNNGASIPAAVTAF